MNPETYHDIVSGDRKGLGPMLIRMALGLVSRFYSFGVGLRNMLYDIGLLPSKTVDCPVVSIGNITSGGTGKTPCAIYVVGKLRELGFKPAIVTRGYGHSDGVAAPGNVHGADSGASDEVMLMARALPETPIVVDKDRVRGARAAIERHDADIIVLDDGFQHRRLKRDIDIVLVDALNPFGYDAILPRGLLREDPANLKRASLIVLSHTDQVGYIEITGIKSRMKSILGGVNPVLSIHQPISLEGVSTSDSFDLEMVNGQKALAYCALGNPESFRETLERLNALVLSFRPYPDHHRFTKEDIDKVQSAAERLHCTFIVVTEKDAVKLRRMEGVAPNTVAVAVEFQLSEGEDQLMELLGTLRPGEPSSQESDHGE